jgi:hypothetical protein
MSTFSDRILKTVIPVIIGTAIPVGGIWWSERIPDGVELDCGTGVSSDSDYLLYFGVIAALGIIYQLILGKFLRNEFKTGKAVELIIDIAGFACLFTVVISSYFLWESNELLIAGPMAAGIILGILHEIFISIFKRII